MSDGKRMDPGIRKQWVKALTSGKYVQGRHKLKTREGKFCCLGVLCDLHARATQTSWELDYNNSPTYIACLQYLPSEVKRWAGMTATVPYISLGQEERELTELNDGNIGGEGSKSFSQIATLIEEQF